MEEVVEESEILEEYDPQIDHVTQGLDDLINLPYIVYQKNVRSLGLRLKRFIRKTFLKSHQWIRIPILLRTEHIYTHERLTCESFGSGSGTSQYTDQRNITISPDNEPSRTVFPKNHIVSNKYTIWNFVPKNLFEQFRRIANFYFLIAALVAAVSSSAISPLTSILPLSFVVFITACKQGYEDHRRYVEDKQINRRYVNVVRSRCVQMIHCESIVVGDLVKVSRDEDIPCDLLLLYSSEEDERCYITTANLDGETNLKTLMVPKVLSKMTTTEIVSMQATITCQHPSSDLYGFHGKLEIENGDSERSGHLNSENLMLRGCNLKYTEHVIGCAIYTGQDTKLSLNSKIRSNKFSTAERSINKYIIAFMVLLIVEVIESCMMKTLMDSTTKWNLYLGGYNTITFLSLADDFFSFAVLYNYIVPISLYVTIELQKFLGSFFFSWDIDLYDEKTDQPALANSSDLNEELGQVEFLFADKTGTLTENMMVFKRCSIDGKMYMEKDCDGSLYLLPPNGDEEQAKKLVDWESDIWHFMISIALCHTVQISPPSVRPSVVAKRIEYRESFRQKKVTRVNSSLLMHPDLPEYQATSADEKALVEASARCGVVFQNSSNDTIELRAKGKQMLFQKMEVLEFTSERKRMSVIVQDNNNDYWLYCKGADSAVFPMIVSGKINEAIAHVADFSMRGFRTLVVAYKKMSRTEYEKLMQRVERARQVIGIERAVHTERAYNQLESGLTLLGVTAVEDRLQEEVQETLESLRVAGIKIWVLTGDKAETAENIAFLCGQFKEGTEVLRMVDITTPQMCIDRIAYFERRMILEPHNHYGLLVDGYSITVALNNCPLEFQTIGMACEAVVCCRLTPLQKSEIVSLVKHASSHPHTAAIGDGGNDIAMIQEAHVGIGIMGKEGRQATMSSDFAIAKFRFLKKVLLVHGQWYYVRISTLTLYFFYKNILFITPQLLFGIHSGFSVQVFYDGMFLMFFNVIFTSVPIVFYGILEQNYSADKLLQCPYLYKMYRHNYLLSTKRIVLWSILGFWHAAVIYFMTSTFISVNPVSLYNNTPVDQWTFSTFVLHVVTLVANLQVLLHSSNWTFPLVLVVILSEFTFIVFAMCYSFIHRRYDGDMLTVFPKIFSSMSLWLLAIVIVVICLIPDYLMLTYNGYMPARITRRNEELPPSVTSRVSESGERHSTLTAIQRSRHIFRRSGLFTPAKIVITSRSLGKLCVTEASSCVRNCIVNSPMSLSPPDID
ncbi:phospholipid-transporting ATPase IF [Lasioglossum baleicum]|uniref:phospholipid-transporting ATPase IF n=1 Tax=Lasioglossum baleicum TaxID=434251 RepID=UPI003FCEE22A